jgi:hypothetical protein
MLGAVSFWLETLWWGGIAVLGIGATLNSVANSDWAERRRQRRFARRFKPLIEARARSWRNRVRDAEVAELRAREGRS